MKKYIILAVAVLLLGGAAIAKAVPLHYLPSTQAGGVASSTASFVLANGSITKTFSSDGIQQVTWLVAMASSSTPPTLSWTNQYSNNGTDWYSEDSVYASSTTHIAAEKVENWLYATSSATTIISTGPDGVTKFIGRKIVVPNLDTQFTRTIFTVTGANARVDIQRSLKNEVVTVK